MTLFTGTEYLCKMDGEMMVILCRRKDLQVAALAGKNAATIHNYLHD